MKPIYLKAGPARPAFPHDVYPDDDPEPGNRCKRCGQDVWWSGPNDSDWHHVGEDEEGNYLPDSLTTEQSHAVDPDPAKWRIEDQLLHAEFGVHDAVVQGDDRADGDDRGEDRCPNCDHTRYQHVEHGVTEGAFGWTCQQEPRTAGRDPFGRTKDDFERQAEND